MKRILTSFVILALLTPVALAQPSGAHHFLYVAAPGIRDYLQFGGAGILVFDIDHGHRFVKRIDTPESHASHPDNMKGICACAATKKLYFTTPKKIYCIDLLTDNLLWQKQLPLGCDRMSITPDGKFLYVPTFENVAWNVVNGETGDLIKTVETKNGAHNTVVGLDGSKMYLGGLKSPWLFVADTKSQAIVKKVGPFSGAIRPFTVDGKQSRCYVCVNGLLGFEIGDLASGKVVARVAVEGFKTGPVKRHGCPSHGVGLTPDEKEAWVCDGHNSLLHVFDLTKQPPKQIASIALRDQPGWVTFSIDGKYAYPSTGEVIDRKSKKILTALKDEKNRPVHSEKMVEVDFKDGKPVRSGDQFGVGRVR